MECVAHAFGKHRLGIVHDMWVMRHVDVFVTFHGAGEMNAICPCLGASDPRRLAVRLLVVLPCGAAW